ncbi:keratin, type I cytoskeletal 9-like [Impatiens glandulifera]|uniref:keratin, type I cytoskeletal 9-like n=1 Tax=Impatiens glandulifera TaxID=253017 RepID=UPI001FB07638|nr:keratin, type I cytoskeletal 9-like [Impatiens glandulifera]
MLSIEKGQRSNKKEVASLLETHKEMEKTMKMNKYEINILNNTYSKFEKNFFKQQSKRFDCEREFNIDLHQEIMAGVNMVQDQVVELINHMNRVDAERMEQADSFAIQIHAVENVEIATNKEKNLLSLDVDNVQKGEGSSRGGKSSRGGVLTGTRSKRKLVDEGGCRPTKRGGGRSGDRGGGSGGRGGRGGRTLPPIQNLLTGEEFSYPNVKREEQ